MKKTGFVSQKALAHGDPAEGGPVSAFQPFSGAGRLRLGLGDETAEHPGEGPRPGAGDLGQQDRIWQAPCTCGGGVDDSGPTRQGSDAGAHRAGKPAGSHADGRDDGDSQRRGAEKAA